MFFADSPLRRGMPAAPNDAFPAGPPAYTALADVTLMAEIRAIMGGAGPIVCFMICVPSLQAEVHGLRQRDMA